MVRSTALCEPVDDSMYVSMSHSVGDHCAHSRPARSKSAPHQRPPVHGSSTQHMHRYDGLITIPQKRHAEHVVVPDSPRGGDSFTLDSTHFHGFLPRRGKPFSGGAPTGVDKAIYGGSLIDRPTSPKVFDGAVGMRTRPDSLIAAEAGDSPTRLNSIETVGRSIWQEPATYSNTSGQHVRELLHGRRARHESPRLRQAREAEFDLAAGASSVHVRSCPARPSSAEALAKPAMVAWPPACPQQTPSGAARPPNPRQV